MEPVLSLNRFMKIKTGFKKMAINFKPVTKTDPFPVRICLEKDLNCETDYKAQKST